MRFKLAPINPSSTRPQISMQRVSNLLPLPICSRQQRTSGDKRVVLTSQRTKKPFSHTHLSFGDTQSLRRLDFKHPPLFWSSKANRCYLVFENCVISMKQSRNSSRAAVCPTRLSAMLQRSLDARLCLPAVIILDVPCRFRTSKAL